MLIYNMTQPLKHETIWFDKYKYDDAERQFEELKAKTSNDSCDQDCPPDEGHNQNVLNEKQERPPVIQSLADEIALARRRIQNTLQRGDNPEVPCICEDAGYRRLADRLQVLEDDNLLVKKMVADVESHFKLFTSRLNAMEAKYGSKAVSAAVSECVSNGQRLPDDDDDDNMELFCSDGEDEDTSKLHKERLEAYENKKSKKSPVVAKSSVVLDIKPWDDETNMEEMEKGVREIQSDGLKWGASKLVPLAYGIQKLQIVVIVEDNKISVDWLQETIQEIDLVQSVDIAAFNKL